MKIAFLLGSPDISGGTYVIFQHALALQYCGHDVVLVTEEPVSRERIGWHPGAHWLKFSDYSGVAAERFDAVLATWWVTVYKLHRLASSFYGYFVQSIESRFYEHDDHATRMWADSTYSFPLPVITEAKWIAEHLTTRFGRTVSLAPNGIRKDIYTAEGPAVMPRVPGRLRVLVEGPLGVFFKNVERTVELCRRSAADEVWLLTSTPDVRTYPGCDRVFSRVPAAETADVYRSCDAVVKLSYVEGMFGPPLEMFHCGGTAIVYDVTGHDEYIRDRLNAFVVPRDDEAGVIARIAELKDASVSDRLKRAALETAAAWPSWEDASRTFESALHGLVARASAGSIEQPGANELALRGALVTEWYDRHLCLQREAKELRRTAEESRASTERISYELEQLRKQLHASDTELRHVSAEHRMVLESRSFRWCQSLRALAGMVRVRRRASGVSR